MTTVAPDRSPGLVTWVLMVHAKLVPALHLAEVWADGSFWAGAAGA